MSATLPPLTDRAVDKADLSLGFLSVTGRSVTSERPEVLKNKMSVNRRYGVKDRRHVTNRTFSHTTPREDNPSSTVAQSYPYKKSVNRDRGRHGADRDRRHRGAATVKDTGDVTKHRDDVIPEVDEDSLHDRRHGYDNSGHRGQNYDVISDRYEVRGVGYDVNGSTTERYDQELDNCDSQRNIATVDKINRQYGDDDCDSQRNIATVDKINRQYGDDDCDSQKNIATVDKTNRQYGDDHDFKSYDVRADAEDNFDDDNDNDGKTHVAVVDADDDWVERGREGGESDPLDNQLPTQRTGRFFMNEEPQPMLKSLWLWYRQS